MSRKGFSLLELLVVVGIMGFLGTISIGAYRSVVRGMEERGAVQNANQFMHAAFQRAMIDRQPTAVYYWNETLRSGTADDNEIVVGKAVAVRRGGRLSGVDGKYLYDEFADLNLTYSTNSSGSAKSSAMYLYKLDNVQEGLKRSRVRDTVVRESFSEIFLLDPTDGQAEQTVNLPPPSGAAEITVYGFEIMDGGNASWSTGDAYGFEFQSLELPHNYIFGSAYSTDISNPVRGEGSVVFGGGAGGYDRRSGNMSGGGTIDIYALRPDSSGSLKPTKVGTTRNPTEEGI